MTRTARLLSRRLTGRDEGFAMILVLGFTAILAALIAVGTTIGIRSLRSSRAHANFEQGLAVAESGVDSTLATINSAFNAVPSTNYVTTGSCAITTLPATFSSDQQERTLVRDAMLALPDSCLVTTAGGQYIAVRPSNHRVVYSMSWVPSRATSGAKRRLVKAEYLFAPYKPSNAVLTQGSLDFSGSVAITTLTSSPSDVHSNLDVSGYNGSTNIQGQLSASGSLSGSCPGGITGGCAAGAAVQSVPVVNARTYYNAKATEYAANWHDLCPDGTMRMPSSTPCTGTAEATTNGWEFAAGSGTTPPTWTIPAKAGGPFNGVYYVYQGDAVIGGNGNSKETWQISVLAEAAPSGGTAAHCGKLGGNVSWKLFNLTPWLSGLQLLADADLTGNANASAGSGLFLAGDKIDLNTSSAVMTGAVIASNACAAAGNNTIQGVTVNYDDTLESPLSDIIRTSLWLDYAAG